MTINEKVAKLKVMMNEDDLDEDVIKEYLLAAQQEILQWRYSYAESMPATVPAEYEMTEIFAVIEGYSQIGAEGQTRHTEGSIDRLFSYDTMIGYIRNHVIPIVRCI